MIASALAGLPASILEDIALGAFAAAIIVLAAACIQLGRDQ